MLDWSARIDDLAEYLAREYAIEDRLAIEILLAALIECPRTQASWLILETNWYSRWCMSAWFSFGEQWIPRSLPQIRARSPWREIERLTIEWLDAPSEQRLFVEPDFERYPYYSRLTNAHYMLQRSLRVRTKSSRTGQALKALDEQEEDRRTDQLAALTRSAIDDRVRARPHAPPAFRQPANFLYHVELVQRMAPWYPDWDTLLQAFATLAVRHAYLYGQTETGPAQDRMLARLATDSVPPWVAKALRLLGQGPSSAHVVEKAMGLEEWTRRTGHGAHRELVRLRRAGLIEWSPRKMHWAIVDKQREGILEVLNGEAFSRDRAQPAA